ncbi:Uncharacterized protein VirK/YbjX [Rhizobacter sp. OV335]|nr:Uncharacterized protein VirK/YbjX [Rhizobacter sp. OV335]
MFAAAAQARVDWHVLFRSTDDGAGGRWATYRRAVKFFWRFALRKAGVQICRVSLHRLKLEHGAHYPIEVSLRPLRPYLCDGLSVSDRAACVVSHFSWLHATLRSDTCRALWQRQCLLFPLASETCTDVSLVLRQSASQSREGELSFDLLFQGQRLVSTNFSIVGARAAGIAGEERSVALIAGFQGVRGTEALMRELGTQLHRLRPSSLLLCALQGVCAGWDLPAPVTVAQQSHVSAGYARRRNIQLDYDRVWTEAGAARLGSRHWQLPETPGIRPDSEVASKHRAQHRRRNATKLAFFEACREAASAMKRNSVASAATIG